jgi:hypothetical protein
MNKKALFVSAVLMAAISTQAFAFVQIINIRMENHSDVCAWITLYQSRPGLPWLDMKAFWIKRGQVLGEKVPIPNPVALVAGVPVPVPGEVRVRAEFMSTTDCSHPVRRDTSGDKKGLWFSNFAPGPPEIADPDATFYLSGDNKGSYWVRVR